VTRILDRIQEGDERAAKDLWQLVYDELRKLAAYRLRSESKEAMRPTELVHEAYVRLVDADQVQNWKSRGQFFAAAGEAMRRILVDAARARSAVKRGGQIQQFDLNLNEHAIDERASVETLLAIDEALDELEKRSSVGASIVKLRFFGGMQHKEAAESLGLSRREGDRHWAVARNWLYRWLGEPENRSPPVDSEDRFKTSKANGTARPH
jgi:RNA polymerase sigma factor (TIGR02999 family)